VPLGREVILETLWVDGVWDTSDHSHRLQLLQSGGKCLAWCAGEPLNVREPMHAELEFADDEKRPFVADQLQCISHPAHTRAVGVRRWVFPERGGRWHASTVNRLAGAVADRVILLRSKCRSSRQDQEVEGSQVTQSDAASGAERASRGSVVVAGGSFWGVQEMLRDAPGVLWTRVGYAGGSTEHPTYLDVGDHAEAVEVRFDPTRTTLRDVLLLFLRVHDPTTPARQGEDIGERYRSLILTSSALDRQVAESTVAAAEQSGRWPARIVTVVGDMGVFWEAEASHQDHLRNNPKGYNPHFLRANWRLDD